MANQGRRRDVMPLIEEIENSHGLLFGPSPASRRLARRFYGVPVFKWTEHYVLRDIWWEELSHVHLNPFDAENVPIAQLLDKFPWLAERMVHVLETMENWKPKTFRELFIPGYIDRTTGWIAMFGIFFGFVSVFGLVLNGYQIYLGQRQMEIALKTFALQFNATA
jgi:hypothetical protein